MNLLLCECDIGQREVFTRKMDGILERSMVSSCFKQDPIHIEDQNIHLFVTFMAAFQFCCEQEGIIPALEPSHALAHVMKIAPELPADHIICMNMCGRGDKDIFTVARALGVDMGEAD